MKTKLNSTTVSQIKTAVLNFGPQHPASHGVLRLVLQINGELIQKIDPHIGFLHRGSERLAESQNFSNGVVFTDRLDYTSVLTQTHAYCQAVESLIQNNTQTTANDLFRIMFDELARMLNHLLAISTHSLDVGSMAPLFWAFEDRERIMELVEYVSGARMHAALYAPAVDASTTLTASFFFKLLTFLKTCHKSYTEMFISLFNNRVWRLRLSGIGVLKKNDAILFGATGLFLRSSGCSLDLRAGVGYSSYSTLSFRIYTGVFGDSYDRFLIRSRELFESIHILAQITFRFLLVSNKSTALFLANSCLFINNGTEHKTKMEGLISRFKVASDFIEVSAGVSYKYVEAGKGEFGVMLVSNGSAKPHRLYLRSPAFNNLQLLPLIGAGCYFADLVTLVGSLDLVFGEVDR